MLNPKIILLSTVLVQNIVAKGKKAANDGNLKRSNVKDAREQEYQGYDQDEYNDEDYQAVLDETEYSGQDYQQQKNSFEYPEQESENKGNKKRPQTDLGTTDDKGYVTQDKSNHIFSRPRPG